MRLGATAQRRLTIGSVSVGIALLAVPLRQTWTTVPAELTGVGRPVGLTGSLLQETSYAFTIVMSVLLVVVALLRGGRRTTAAFALAFFAMLAFSQTLDVAVDPTKAVLRFQETTAPVLGLDLLEDRDVLRALEREPLPTSAAAWLSMTGALVAGAGAVLVVVRGRRWDDARGSATDEWWRS